jgi:hypothetical protein
VIGNAVTGKDQETLPERGAAGGAGRERADSAAQWQRIITVIKESQCAPLIRHSTE